MSVKTDAVLCRSVPFELRDDPEGDGNTLVGYAAVFGSPTRIDSSEGIFDEDIAPGAFKRSLAERTPVLQFDHGRHPMVGSIPLGWFRNLAEDKHGLDVDAPLHDNWLVQPVRDAVKSKAIPGMSFRFSVVEDVWRTAAGEPIPESKVDSYLARSNRDDPASVPRRTLRDVNLYELGPVVFPAYADTSVGVRSRELAELLTDSQVRADLARLLVGEPVAPGESVGDSGERSAVSGDEEPQEATVTTRPPSPEARNRALLLLKEGI